MKKITLQIQSVIYKNKIEALLQAIEGINTAINVCREKDFVIEANLCYGDASPEPVLQEGDIQRIIKSYENINLCYKFFRVNSGTAKGHNFLGENCKTDYMMIMNPDVILETTCLWELLIPFEDSEVGMVEARQTPLELAKAYNMETLETEWASTACTVFKTEIFHELKGFDEKTFFMYCDDLDFSWRLRLEGYKIIYNPNAIIYHSKKLTSSGEWKPTPAEIYYSAEAAILMAYKWSNFERVEKLLKQFDTVGGPDEKKAANEFRKKRDSKMLPSPIDAEHKIAKFIGDNYSLMRFGYSK